MTSAARTNHATAVALARRKSSQSEADALREQIRLLEHEVMRLQQLNAALREQRDEARRAADELAMQQKSDNPTSKYLVYDGKRVGNYRQYCEYHNLPKSDQYKVSRWVARGELQTVTLGGRRYVVLGQDVPVSNRANQNAPGR